MPEDTRLQLGVTLDLGTDTISGTVQDGASPIIEFTGWLELMSALDTATARATKLWPKAKWSEARRSAPVDSPTTHKARDVSPRPEQHADRAPDDQAAAQTLHNTTNAKRDHEC